MLNTIPKRVSGYCNKVRRQEPSKLAAKVSIPKRVLTILARAKIQLSVSSYIEDTS